MLVNLSFALDRRDKESFYIAFRRYFNKVLPERIAISSLYRAFVYDFTRNPWDYMSRFDKYDFDTPKSSDYDTYTFKCDKDTKERFYNNNYDLGVKPSALLRCFTFDFAVDPAFYISRYGGKDVSKASDNISPLQFFDM